MQIILFRSTTYAFGLRNAKWGFRIGKLALRITDRSEMGVIRMNVWFCKKKKSIKISILTDFGGEFPTMCPRVFSSFQC